MATDTLEDLKKKIKLPNSVTLEKGQGGLTMAKVKADGATAEIYLHGAHVTHFQGLGEPPLLWMSKQSKFDDASPIRGGIPVIFPWFGGRTGSSAHGFARVKNWELAKVSQLDKGAVELEFRLPETAEAGFSDFAVSYTVTVSDALQVALTVTNTAPGGALSFEACLHSYFTIGDISAISVKGLKGTKFIDKVDGGIEKTEMNDAITISSEVDRVYQDTTATVEIHDSTLRRRILVEKSGSASTVLWNPWVAKSKAMADFGDEEYHQMVCVETGNVGKNSVSIGPGKTATMAAKLSSARL